MRNVFKVVATLLVAAAGSGCGGDFEKDARFASLDELKAAVEQAGYECGDWSTTHEEGDATHVGICDDLLLRVGPGGSVDIEGGAVGLAFRSVSGEFEPAMIASQNWTIGGPESDVKRLQSKLGGEPVDVVGAMGEFTDKITGNDG